MSRSGNEGVFLIGAPRTGKDQVVRRAVQRVAGEGVLDRIHLLDKDITDEYIATQVKRIDALNRDERTGPDPQDLPPR